MPSDSRLFPNWLIVPSFVLGVKHQELCHFQMATDGIIMNIFWKPGRFSVE